MIGDDENHGVGIVAEVEGILEPFEGIMERGVVILIRSNIVRVLRLRHDCIYLTLPITQR